MGRLRDGEWIAGAGGIGLLVALFLHWYSVPLPPVGKLAFPAFDDAAASGWQAFSVLDVVLALVALVALALVALQATCTSPSLPVLFSVFTFVLGLLATLLVLYRIVDQPGPNDLAAVEPGAWIGLAAAALTGFGGWRSMRVEAIPGAPMPPIEDLPAPAP
jgi:hypothetical protein